MKIIFILSFTRNSEIKGMPNIIKTWSVTMLMYEFSLVAHNFGVLYLAHQRTSKSTYSLNDFFWEKCPFKVGNEGSTANGNWSGIVELLYRYNISFIHKRKLKNISMLTKRYT